MADHLRAFLGADDATLTRRLTAAGTVRAVLDALPGTLSGPAEQALGAELTAAAGGLLEEDLDSILLSGLLGYRGLVDAARRTAAEEDMTSLVTLDHHLVRVTSEPSVEVLVDRHEVYELRLTLTVTFTVQGLVATVRAGRLAHVRIGRCSADVSLSWAGQALVRHSGLVDAPLVLKLGSGVPVPQVADPADDPALARGTARVPGPRVAQPGS